MSNKLLPYYRGPGDRHPTSGLEGSTEFISGFDSHRAFPAAVAESRYPHNYEHNL